MVWAIWKTFVLRDAGDVFDLFRGPFLHFLADVVHGINPFGDVILVFPSVLEDVPEQPVDERDVGAGPDPGVDVGMGGRAGEARVHDDHDGARLLGAQDVLHGHGVGLGRIAAEEQHGLAVPHVVVGIGHGAVAPGVGHAVHGGGVADARLVVHVVGAPEGGEFPLQVGPLVARLGGPAEEKRVRSRLRPDLEKLVADLVDGLIPGKARPGAVHQLHGELHALLAEAVASGRGPFAAVSAEIEGRIVVRLLADPYAVLQLGDDAAPDGAVGAYGPPVFRLHSRLREIALLLRRGLPHASQRQQSKQRSASKRHAAPDEKGAPGDVLRGSGFRGYPMQPLFIECCHGSIPPLHVQSIVTALPFRNIFSHAPLLDILSRVPAAAGTAPGWPPPAGSGQAAGPARR